jgi:hypothetical protein
MTAALMVMSFAIMGRRPANEVFASFWSAVMLFLLSIGGTMIMRKFHNSMAVGFFMGSVCTCSQMFFSLSLVYIGYGEDQELAGLSSREEKLMALLAFLQSLLLGSFAAILAAHRTEILESKTSIVDVEQQLSGTGSSSSKQRHQDEAEYEAPRPSSKTGRV